MCFGSLNGLLLLVVSCGDGVLCGEVGLVSAQMLWRWNMKLLGHVDFLKSFLISQHKCMYNTQIKCDRELTRMKVDGMMHTTLWVSRNVRVGKLVQDVVLRCCCFEIKK